MRIAYVVAGTSLLAATGCQLTSSPTSAAPPVTVPAAAPPATVYVTPTEADPTFPAFVTVPDMAHRRLDVAEYMLSSVGLGHTVVGDSDAADHPDEWVVCASQPRADTHVHSGTRIALIVEETVCI